MRRLGRWLDRWRADANGVPPGLARAWVRLAERVRAPRMTAPPVGRLAVIAPHMDDEVFGCGGTLARAARAGAEVTVVFVTDGRGGHTRGPGATPEFTRALSARRREESRRAGRRLGFNDPIFLDLPDHAFGVSRATVSRLARILADLRPDAVFVPFFADQHRDHVLAGALFARAAGAARLAGATACWSYEVWSPLPATAVVDITPVMDLKRAAMAEFASQLEYCDYAGAVEALNAYRSLAGGLGRGWAEAFHTAPLPVYLALHR